MSTARGLSPRHSRQAAISTVTATGDDGGPADRAVDGEVADAEGERAEGGVDRGTAAAQQVGQRLSAAGSFGWRGQGKLHCSRSKVRQA